LDQITTLKCSRAMADVRVKFEASAFGLCGVQSETAAGSFQRLLVSPVISIPPMFHSHLLVCNDAR